MAKTITEFAKEQCPILNKVEYTRKFEKNGEWDNHIFVWFENKKECKFIIPIHQEQYLKKYNGYN